MKNNYSFYTELVTTIVDSSSTYMITFDEANLKLRAATGENLLKVELLTYISQLLKSSKIETFGILDFTANQKKQIHKISTSTVINTLCFVALLDDKNTTIGFLIALIDHSIRITPSQKDSLLLVSKKISKKLQLNKSINKKIKLGTDTKSHNLQQLKIKETISNSLKFSKDVFCTIDSEGKFESVSDTSYKVWGYTSEEMIGKHYKEYIIEEDPTSTIEAVLSPKNSIELNLFENKYRHKNGSIIDVLWSALWEVHEELLYCIAKDVTNFKPLVKKNAENEHLLVEAQKLAKIGSWNFDFKIDKLTWTDGLYEVFGVNKDIFLETHSSFIDFIIPEDRDFVIQTSKNTRETGEHFNIIYRIKTPFGEERYIEEFGYSEKNSKGVIVRLFGTAQDITERKKTELSLKESNKKYKYLFENNPLPLFIFDFKTLKIEDCNTESLLLYGYTKEEFLKLTILDIRPEEDKKLVFEATENETSYGEIHKKTWRHLKKNGEMMYVEITGHLLEYNNRKCSLVLINDITTKIKLENKQKEYTQFIETTLENLPIGIAVNKINEGTATLMNPKFSEVYGWTKEDLTDVTTFFEKVYPNPEYREKIVNQVIKDISSKDPTRMNWTGIKIVTSTGDTRIINAKNIPLYNQNLMISTVTDITVEYNQSKEIERIKNNQEALINSTNDFIWSIDTNLKIITLNDSLKKYVKKYLNKKIQEGDSILYRELGELNYQKWVRLYEKALQGNKFSIKDENFNSVTNKMEYRDISFNPIYNLERTLLGISCYSKNNDKDAKHLFQLEKTQKELKKILDFSLDLICTINESGIFTQVNNASYSILGYYPEELLGTPFINYVLPDDFKKSNTTAQNVINGEVLTNFTNRYIHKDNSIVNIEWSARWDDTTKLMFCIARDVTEKSYIEKIENLERNVYEAFSNSNVPIETILSNVSKGVELIHPDMICSFLEVRNNHLYRISENRLPKNFNDAIEGVEIGQNVGSCGTAAFTKKKVFVTDIAHDICWIDYKELALRNDLKACWSIPILNSQNEVMATFALYYNKIKAPTLLEEKTIDRTSKLLQIILENDAKEKEIIVSNQRYEYVTKVTFDAIWDWDMITDQVFWGENYYELFGEMLHLNQCSDLEKIEFRIHPEEREEISRQISNTIKSKENTWSFEHRYLKSNESYAYVINKALIIRNSNGRAIRVIGSMQDITKQKEELQRLKLMESVITHTNDAVLITEAEPYDEPGPKIIYVNDAFTKMTGYTFEEVIGKTPRILQGPKSDDTELKKLSEAIRNWKPYEITTINYKKNGEPFWINFTINPVANEKGWYTHWVAIERDVTIRKTEELQKTLMTELSIIFNKNNKISEALEMSLEKITQMDSFDLGEVWLLNPYQETVSLQASYSHSINKNDFYNFTKFTEYKKNDGLIWNCITTKKIHFTNTIQEDSKYLRKEAAKKIGLKTIYTVPLIVNSEVIGVIVLGALKKLEYNTENKTIFKTLGENIGNEIKRKQLENELNYMFETAPDILCLISLDGFFKKVNPSAMVLLGYEEEHLLKIPFKDLIYPLDQKNSETSLLNLSTANPIIYFENRLITKTNKIIWLAWSVTKDSEQNLYFGVAKDITQKKELERLLDNATNLAKIGGWELNVSENTLYWSPITKQIHEVPLDYIPDVETAISFYREGHSKKLISESINQILETGEPFEHELQIITPSGKDKWIKVIGEAEFRNGDCIRVYGSFQDINTIKQAQIALQNAFLEKNSILESIGDAFFRVDRNWKVIYWNQKAEEILNKPKNEIINKNLWEEFPDIIDTEFFNNYHAAINENTSNHFEAYYKTLKKWFEVSAYPYDNGLSIYFRDVTYRKKIEIEMDHLNNNLQKRSKELEISNKELEQFAYIASHDLQEPLRMVTSFLALIEKKYDPLLDEKGRKYIHFAVDGAKRMRQIILDLLEFSRVGKEPVFNQDIDINEIIEEIRHIYTNNSENDNVVIEVLNPLPSVRAQKLPLRQVFQNLISNGIKYKAENRDAIIKIQYENLPDFHRFTISDNGIGIHSEYHDKIFNIFQRLHQKEEYEGTGIGLAITKKIVENLKGTIGLTSTVGQGSSFYFTILKKY